MTKYSHQFHFIIILFIRLPQADSNVPKKPKSAERTKGRPTLVKNANNVNIKTTESKKPSPKKAAETVKKVGKQKPTDHPHNSSSLVVAASEKVSSLTSISTKVDTSGRRVSTRSKKPGKMRDMDSQNYFQFYFVGFIIISIQQNWCCNKSLCFTQKRIIWIPQKVSFKLLIKLP